MLRVIGAHYKSRDELAIPPDVCDITLSFFLKGGGGGEGASIFARENPFAIIYRRVLYLAGKVKTMGDNLGGPRFRRRTFSKKKIGRE